MHLELTLLPSYLSPASGNQRHGGFHSDGELVEAGRRSDSRGGLRRRRRSSRELLISISGYRTILVDWASLLLDWLWLETPRLPARHGSLSSAETSAVVQCELPEYAVATVLGCVCGSRVLIAPSILLRCGSA